MGRRRAALVDHAAHADGPGQRRDRRRRDPWLARGSRRVGQLGLSLLLAAQLDLHADRAAQRRLSRRGDALARLDIARGRRPARRDADRLPDRRRPPPARNTRSRTCPAIRASTPVRIGNAASGQTQLDVFGELMDSFAVLAKAGIERTPRVVEVETAIVEHLEKVWDQPSADIWESRGDPQCYTYSQAMAWVGVTRFLAAHANDDQVDRALIARLKELSRSHPSDRVRARLQQRSRPLRPVLWRRHPRRVAFAAAARRLPSRR